MQDESIRDGAREFQAEEYAVLDLLLQEDHVIWSMSELSSALDRGASSTAAIDAVNRLQADGLLHRIGEFVFASRAAARAWQIHI